MNIFNFAHGNAAHSSAEVAHEGSSNTVWIILASVVMAGVLYGVIRLLSSRQTQEQESKDETES